MKQFDHSYFNPSNHPRAGELALAKSALFASNELSLYCGVPVSDLASAKDPTPWAEGSDRSRIDYLVCRGADVIMAIEITERDGPRGLPFRVDDLYFGEMTETQMEQGEVSHILRQLERLLKKAGPPLWTCPMTDYPDRQADPLFDEQLLRWVMGPTPPRAVVPTGYGASTGIVKAYPYSSEETLCIPMCSPRVARRLEEVLSSNRRTPVDRRQIPLAERLQSMKAGLPGNSIHSASAVQVLIDPPLETYLFEFQEELDTLDSGLMDPCDTFGEAAQAIYYMMLFGDERSTSLAQALTEPIATEYHASIGARWAAEVTGKMPTRKCMVAYTDAGGQSLEARIARLRQPANPGVAAVSNFLSLSLESFFQGVSLLAGIRYPLWLAKRIKEVYELSDGYPYGDLVAHANRESAQEDEERAADGEELLYLLAVEPFELIRKNQTTKRS